MARVKIRCECGRYLIFSKVDFEFWPWKGNDLIRSDDFLAADGHELRYGDRINDCHVAFDILFGDAVRYHKHR